MAYSHGCTLFFMEWPRMQPPPPHPPPHPPSPPNFSQPSMEDLSQTQSVPDILISRGRAWHGLTLDWHGQRCMCVPVEKVLQLSSGFMLSFKNCVKYTTFWTTFCELYRFIPGKARLRHKRAAAIEGSTAGGGGRDVTRGLVLGAAGCRE